MTVAMATNPKGITFGDNSGLPICPVCGEMVTVGIEPDGFNKSVYIASCGCYTVSDESYMGALNEWIDRMSGKKKR